MTVDNCVLCGERKFALHATYRKALRAEQRREPTAHFVTEIKDLKEEIRLCRASDHAQLADATARAHLSSAATRST